MRTLGFTGKLYGSIRGTAIQLDDALSLRRLIGGRGQRGQMTDIRRRQLAQRYEARGSAIAHRDRAGLVQEERIHIAGHFDGFAALGENVGPQGAIHAGNTDGRQQRPDRRRNEAYQQCDQRRNVGAEAARAVAEIDPHVQLGMPRHRPQRRRDDEENQGERGQNQRQGDLVGRALADRAFDEGDHAVEKRFAGPRRDLHDDAIGQKKASWFATYQSNSVLGERGVSPL